jgi:hypothetical protein
MMIRSFIERIFCSGVASLQNKKPTSVFCESGSVDRFEDELRTIHKIHTLPLESKLVAEAEEKR